jgi:ATP-dependent helicase HrpB
LPQPLGHAPFLAIADLDGDPAESRIWLAAPLSETELREAAGPALVTEQVVGWDDDADEVIAVERERLGAIILRERPLRTVDADAIASALAASLKRRGLDALTWSDSALALRRRLAFAHQVDPATYADVSDAALLDALEDWLLPALHGVRRRAELARVDLGAALLARVEWAARARLDRLAPTHLEVPSGSRIAIDYTDPTQPVLAVKLQEVFGLLDTPRIGEGRVPITMHLLSPAGRPVQVTRDLASFWRAGYFDVKKDLKGRYPRHPWPDDPLVAAPTRRVKPRGT